MTALARALCALGLFAPALAGAQSIALTGAAYDQDFDTLANTGSSATLPNGWYLHETSTTSPANTQYTADNGGANSGTTYSYGTTGAAERAFGGLASNSNSPTIGARLVNATGATLAKIDLAYDGEQWRLGATGRTDPLDFQYSLDATSLTSGTWLDVDALDFVAPSTGTPGVALDGNAAPTRVTGSIEGLALANGAAIWIRWRDTNISGNDDGLAIDELVISTAPAVDVPPTVASTTPANGAGSVARDANLIVAFSEPVTLTGAWFSLQCPTTGTRNVEDFTRTGGPASYTLDPAVGFAYGETCTGTIVGANVADQDGTPETLAADVAFSFTVAPEPVDVAPTVASVVPANGATGVAPTSTVRVTFSEAVTPSAGAFALACGSTPQTIAVADSSSGAGTQWTLTPAGALPELATCTLAVTASAILDRDGTPTAMAANFTSSFTTRAGVAGYYDTVDASSCTALRATLHAVIDDHQFFPYTASTPDTWDILNAADQDPADTGNIVDIYKNASYDKIPGGTGVYNREHTWPNSYGFNDRTGDEAYTDTHMLYASDSNYNSTRGNKPFDRCPALSGCTALPTDTNNGRGGSATPFPENQNWYSVSNDAFEVWGGRKGDAARAILYMDLRYEGGTNALSGRAEPDLVVTDTRALIQGTNSGVFVQTAYMGMRSVLLEWHAADPPDAHEQLRNDLVQSYQGNRNPFIDHPEWVAIAFQQPCTGAVVQPLVFKDGFE